VLKSTSTSGDAPDYHANALEANKKEKKSKRGKNERENEATHGSGLAGLAFSAAGRTTTLASANKQWT
jgi:hypothetical protein